MGGNQLEPVGRQSMYAFVVRGISGRMPGELEHHVKQTSEIGLVLCQRPELVYNVAAMLAAQRRYALRTAFRGVVGSWSLAGAHGRLELRLQGAASCGEA